MQVPLSLSSSDIKLKFLSSRNVIFGRPGTGKTTAIERLVREYLQESGIKDMVFYLTYSRNMAQKARERLGGSTITDLPDSNVGTFHSILSSVLEWHLDVADPENSVYLTDMDIREFTDKWGMKKRSIVRTWDSEIEEADVWTQFSLAYDIKNNSMDGRAVADFLHGVDYNVNFVAADYEKFKKSKNKHDFTDILLASLTADLPQCDLLFVDEAQDLTPLMWQIVERWSEKAEKFIVVGDDLQSIYTFRGADVKYFLERKETSKVFHLSKSYRLPATVKKVTDNIAGAIWKKEEVTFEDSGKPGSFIRSNIDEYLKLEGEKWLLCRTNFIAYKVGKILQEMNIPFLPLNEKHANISPWSVELIDIVN